MDIEKTRLIPIERWNDYHDWPPLGGLRHLRFHSETRVTPKGKKIPGNGFVTAFKKVGKRILVDETEFFRCVDRVSAAEKKISKSA
jgi:hypothetical protein